jgi:magnesium-transporting ATPase (P-type)
MSVQEIWAGNAHYTVASSDAGPDAIRLAGDRTTIGWALREVLVAATLCNNAAVKRHDGDWQVDGNAADQALLAAAIKGGIDPTLIRDTSPRIGELVRLPDWQATAHRGSDGTQIFLKGTPESILPRCNAMLDTHGRRWDLDPADVEERVAAMRERCLSVVAFARGVLNELRPPTVADCSQDLIFVGLAGLMLAPAMLR